MKTIITLKELADITGVSSVVIKNWGKKGLVHAEISMRPSCRGTDRTYGLDAIGRVRFIKKFREEGDSFDDIKAYFSDRLYEGINEEEVEEEVWKYRFKESER